MNSWLSFFLLLSFFDAGLAAYSCPVLRPELMALITSI